MSMMGHAVAAVQRGMHVFPCGEPESADITTGGYIDKVPHLLEPGKPWRIKWGEAATNDLAQVIHWWQKWPDANYAIACKPSGVLVVDCDVPKIGLELVGTNYQDLYKRYGKYVEGFDVYREMCLRSGGDWDEALDTYQVATGSGGLHLYYWWPNGLPASQGSLLRGLLDIRCSGGTDGGYVLGPGSRTSKGPYAVESHSPIAPTPAWLVERCREKTPAAIPKAVYAGGVAMPGRAPGDGSGLVNAVAYAAGGNVNNTLLWAARAMCTDGIDVEEAVNMLVPAYVMANGRGGAPHGTDTVRSAYRLQQRKEGR